MHAPRTAVVLVVVSLWVAPALGATRTGDASPQMQAAIAFQGFVKATRQAERFEELLPHLCRKDKAFYAFAKQRLDPAAVRQQLAEAGRLDDPKANDLLNADPYDTALRTYRKIAEEARKCVGVEVEGEKALVRVKSIINDRSHDSTATMVLERGEWKLADFHTERLSGTQ